MRMFSFALSILLGLSMGSSGTLSAQGEQKATLVTPDQLEWKDGPVTLPRGAQFVMLVGIWSAHVQTRGRRADAPMG